MGTEGWPRVTEEKAFKGVDGRMMDDGRQVITIAHPELCSGELKSFITSGQDQPTCLAVLLDFPIAVSFHQNFYIIHLTSKRCAQTHIAMQTDLGLCC